MKKRILPLLLCIMLVVGMMPATAFAGVTGTWEVKLNVSESTEYKYNGQNTLALGFGVQSDDLKLKTAQSIVLAIDLSVLDFLQYNSSSEPEKFDPTSTTLVENSDAVAEGKIIKNKPLQAWAISVYYAKTSDGKTGYMQLLASQNYVDFDVSNATDIATAYIGFKSGKSTSDLTSTSIRLVNATEANTLNQSSAVMITDGDKNTQHAILDNGNPDTLTGGVQVSWVGITPTKPAYSGTIAAPTVASNKGGEVELNTVTPSAGGTVKYGYSKTNDGKNITWQDRTTFSGLNVGDTLYFYAKVEETAEYQELVSTASSPVKVLDKEDPICVAPTNVTATFGEKLQHVSITNLAGNTPGSWEWMNEAQYVGDVKDNPHTYKAKFVPADSSTYNTMENIDVQVTVTQVVLSAGKPIMIALEERYTGLPLEPKPTIKTDFYGDMLYENKDYKITKYEDNTNVGKGKIFFEPLANGNYQFTGGVFNFDILRAYGEITIADHGTIVYDGSAVEVGSGKDLNYTYNGDGAVTVKWYADNNNAKGSELAGGAPKNAGTYWIGVSASEGSNFNAVTEVTKQFTIEKKNLTVTANPKTITYGEAPANAGVTYDGFVSGESESTLTGSLSYDYDYTQYGDVGDNYTITPKGVSNSNYDISFVPGKLTVGKKELTNINTSGVSVTKVYDGTTAAGTLSGSISFTGKEGTDDVSITAVPRAYADANVSSTKTVTLDLSLAGAKKDNYKINSTTADISNAKITAYTAVTDKTEKGTSSARIDVLKSSGEFPKVDIDGVGTEKATGTITYSYDSVTNGTWNDVVNALKTADANKDADIQYTFTGNGNYAGASITDTIYVKVTDLGFYLKGTSTKADASNGADVATDTTYGKKLSELVSLKNLEAKVGATPITGTFSIVDADNMLAAGNQTYTVVFTSNDGTYENQTVFAGNVNVAQREVEIKWENAAGRVYGDGKTVTATITNKVGSDDVSLTVANGDKTNAGDYIATASLTGTASANYKLPAVFTQAYTINKATPTGEPSYTKITAAGKTLADAELKTNTITPPGTIKWVKDDGTTELPNTTTVAKNQPYKWLFTPADTANYNTLTGSLTPYYVASSGGSHVSKVQKPEITIIGSGKADLSADGRTATITAAAGHELVSVVLNGKEMGKVEKLTGLKTGDKATITFRAKTDGKAEMDKIIAQKASKLTLMARSKKTAKLNIKVVVKGDLKAITDAGYTVKYKFYRSTKKSAGYKAVLTKKAPSYVNTYGKKGTMYYYKARVMIYDKDGNFVAQTALKQCKYANRLWTK